MCQCKSHPVPHLDTQHQIPQFRHTILRNGPGTDVQPTTSSTDEPPAAYSEPNAKALGKAPLGSEQESAGIDSAKVIEGAEIAPLGEGKIADDPSTTTTTSGGDARKSRQSSESPIMDWADECSWSSSSGD